MKKSFLIVICFILIFGLSCRSKYVNSYGEDISVLSSSVEKMGVMQAEDFVKIQKMTDKVRLSKKYNSEDIAWVLNLQKGKIDGNDAKVSVKMNYIYDYFSYGNEVVPDVHKNRIYALALELYRLSENMSDENSQRGFQRNAACLFGRSGNHDSIPFLEKLSKSKFENVKNRSVESLEILKKDWK
jgi:hypothetical protein